MRRLFAHAGYVSSESGLGLVVPDRDGSNEPPLTSYRQCSVVGIGIVVSDSEYVDAAKTIDRGPRI